MNFRLRYKSFIAVSVRYDYEVPEGMEEIIIPPCTYAVFPNVVEALNRLYSEWLPTSGCELANQPCIENYLAPGSKIEQELWVPIVKK